jgi:ComF family protein
MTVIEKILNVYAPPRCESCGTQGSSLCVGCIADIPSNVHSRCFMCGKWSKDFSTCGKCRRKTPLRNVWVAAEHTGALKGTIHNFKYERNRVAAKELAELIADRLPFLQVDAVTHVPTATSRVRMRGYDHSKLLAQAVGQNLKVKHRTLLGRIGQTQQMGSKRKERLLQVKGVYVSTRKSPKSVLLIDDVLTTGATLSAAAKELRSAGAKEVYAAVIAHNTGK